MSPIQLIADRFELHDLLGRGGMGEVYRAIDAQTGETVAVKALNPEVLEQDPSLLERFVREGEALRQLNHPNIVHVVAAVEEQGRHYLVMEFVEGGSLKDILSSQNMLPAQRAIEIGLDLADALTRAHRLGIIHRDLKPGNVLLARDDTPRLADFGIAHIQDSSHLTQSGTLIGTVDYLSPEGCRGEPPNELSDIWAFGVMLFEMLSGKLPFEGKSMTAKITAILHQPIPDLNLLTPDAPDALVDLIYRMLQKDSHQRIPSVRVVGAELESILKRGEPLTPARVVSPPSVQISRHNLPSHLNKFIGREKEITEVKQTLSEVRLVTLTGSGGVGKTRLLIQVASELLDEYPDGVWLVELAPLTDPGLILSILATTLGVREEVGQPLVTTLIDFLRAKIVLLVLDNCEHLIEACAKLSESLLQACPKIRILASSREALGIAGENVHSVPSLDFPDPDHLPPVDELPLLDSVRLFVERAVSAQPKFAFTSQNAPAVAQICKRLDGIPLAIELAATRVKTLSVEQIAARLDDRFSLLTGGSRTALPRQQTLRALIDWSHSLLTEKEQTLFRRLAVFNGGWTLESAEAVCAGEGVELQETLDLLTRLIDKSLVQAAEREGAVRYSRLETIRQYAREKLLDANESELMRDRHLGFFLNFAEQAEPCYTGKPEFEYVPHLNAEKDNLRAALEWACERQPETACLLAGLLRWFWFFGDDLSEGKTWYARILDSADQSKNTKGTALALLGSGITFASMDFYEEALPLLERSSGLLLEQDDKRRFAESILFLAYCDILQGKNASACELLEKHELTIRNSATPRVLSMILGYWGRAIANARQDYKKAETLVNESIVLGRAQKDPTSLGTAFLNLGHLALLQGDYPVARDCYLESLAWRRKAGVRWIIANSLRGAADIMCLQGDYQRARPYYEEALELEQALGDRLAEALTIYRLGLLAAYEGNPAKANLHFTTSLEIFRARTYPLGIAQNMLGYAILWRIRGNLLYAVRLLANVEMLAKFSLYPTDRIEYERCVTTTRAQLDESTFEKAWAEGAALTLEQAIELALQDE